ncbi:hypothetical protein QYF36_011773 [Acer negundo]|nr:hypothetical protein QYF36_011773 [Acer negundo]
MIGSIIGVYNGKTFNQWIPELQHYSPGVPVVLGGTKLGLRKDKHYMVDHLGLVPVTTAQGEEIHKQIGATYYIECSSNSAVSDASDMEAQAKTMATGINPENNRV